MVWVIVALIITSLVTLLLASLIVYTRENKDTQNYYCYPCSRRLVDYQEYLHHTSLHHPYSKRNQIKTMPSNIDKASVEAYAKAPKTISVRFPSGSADVCDGDKVVLTIPGRPSARRTVSEATMNDKTLHLSNGWTLFTEDGFGRKLKKNKSYVHAKIGKRFTTYKVVGIADNTISLRKVLASASVGLSPETLRKVNAAITALSSASSSVGSATSSALAALRGLR